MTFSEASSIGHYEPASEAITLTSKVYVTQIALPFENFFPIEVGASQFSGHKFLLFSIKMYRDSEQYILCYDHRPEVVAEAEKHFVEPRKHDRRSLLKLVTRGRACIQVAHKIRGNISHLNIYEETDLSWDSNKAGWLNVCKAISLTSGLYINQFIRELRRNKESLFVYLVVPLDVARDASEVWKASEIYEKASGITNITRFEQDY